MAADGRERTLFRKNVNLARYLVLIRQIPATRQGKYAKTAKEKGQEAAIKEMRSALKK